MYRSLWFSSPLLWLACSPSPEVRSVEIEPASPTTADDLTVQVEGADLDGDNVLLTYRWTVDGSPAPQTGPTIAASETAKGQLWQVEVVPQDRGATGLASVRIVNTPPAFASAEVSPQELREASVATCTPGGWSDADADEQGAQVSWWVDGVQVASGPELTGEDFDKGQSVVCQVRPDDGEDVGEAVTSLAVSVLNTAPVLTSATLLGPVSTTDAVAVDLANLDVHDADGDDVSVDYTWTVNDDAAGTEASLAASAHVKGDSVGLTLVPRDDEEPGTPLQLEPLTVVNSPPAVVSAAIAPDSATTDDVLEVDAVFSDADGDDVSAQVTWFVDGSEVTTGPTLDGLDFFAKGQTVVAAVTPSDGDEQGESTSTDGLTISNSPPTPPVVVIDPAFPRPGQALECLIDQEASDVDGDDISYTARWTVDGVDVAEATTTDFADDTIAVGQTLEGEQWSCWVSASDGTDTSAEESATVQAATWAGQRVFTSCGATGAEGPSPADCDLAYAGTPLGDEVTIDGGKQLWTVPLDGTYRIQAFGAQGASGQDGQTGGRGARMRGDFPLSEGDVLTIGVGQEGTTSLCNAGGGGASFVYRADTPFIVAGGGGGIRDLVDQDGCDASTDQEAGMGSGSRSTHGCGLKRASTIGSGGIVSASTWGSGGGSLNHNGQGDVDLLNGGRSLSGSAIGGGTADYPSYGGFGGGGAGHGGCGAGGGGGYSGGDGGRIAGAGGSYNIGQSQSNGAGAREGAGSVTIDLL